MSLHDLLIDALLDPGTADFVTLRRVWASSNDSQLVPRDEEAVEEVHLRLASGHADEALELVEELLDACPVDVELRLLCARCHQALGDRSEACSQRAFANGLVRATLRSGDGQSPQTALEVGYTREEAAVLRALGLVARRSELMQVDGRWIERVECTGPQGEQVVHFAVTLPDGWFQPPRA